MKIFFSSYTLLNFNETSFSTLLTVLGVDFEAADTRILFYAFKNVS